jgi:hypothetical protein
MVNQTLSWTTKATYSARISPQEWEMHKDEVQKMLADGKSRSKVLTLLKEKHGFVAS